MYKNVQCYTHIISLYHGEHMSWLEYDMLGIMPRQIYECVAADWLIKWKCLNVTNFERGNVLLHPHLSTICYISYSWLVLRCLLIIMKSLSITTEIQYMFFECSQILTVRKCYT